ncbi:MAG: hypothetical protein J5529_07830 [Prevotella sp.]|nr:hypothetical protein [Prevotella sp.]
MRITVNDQTIVIFKGATVKDALLRVFTKKGVQRNFFQDVTARDQWGHELDLDAPLREGSNIIYDLPIQP